MANDYMCKNNTQHNRTMRIQWDTCVGKLTWVCDNQTIKE